MALTDTAIRNAKPKAVLYRLSDANGLCIEVTPNASKLWRYRYRFNGKGKMLGLGSYPGVSLAVARQLRDEARQLLTSGVDPSAHRKASKHADAADRHTFEELAREWFEYKRPRWAQSTAEKVITYLEKDVFPQIGAKPTRDLSRPEMVALVREIESRGALNVAKKTRQWLNQIFRFGLAKGAVDVNPATDLDVVAALPPRTRHHPHVTFAELPALLSAVERITCHPMTRWAIKLLMLTGVRPGELRQAPWAEFDLASATWTIPRERMKARRPHIVPLPTQAVEILRELQQLTGSYALAFAGHNADRPMSENTVNKALSAAGYKDRQTGHGFRHLLSTELNSRSYNRDWIERQLAHGDSDAIRDTYNHANYLEHRRKMMQEWSDSLDAAVRKANSAALDKTA
jgi:integrase